ncbi:MAG: type II secretory pathway component PulC [Myxococcota bacterium]|jgi:type II secretory pathway component PulC
MLLLLSLACLPSSNVDERFTALEAENVALSQQVSSLQANQRELMQELARLKQAVIVLEGVARNDLSPADLNAAAAAAAIEPVAGSCQAGDDGVFRIPADQLSPETLSKTIRIIPHKDASGSIDGYRLSAVRRGSVVESCGFKNGDIIHSVNGLPLTSTASSMETYSDLKSETDLTFEVVRRGKKTTLTLGLD